MYTIGTHTSIDESASASVSEEAKSKHLLQMKQAFVQYVSHEVRTPLQVISMGLSMMKEELKEKLMDSGAYPCDTDIHTTPTSATPSPKHTTQGAQNHSHNPTYPPKSVEFQSKPSTDQGEGGVGGVDRDSGSGDGDNKGVGRISGSMASSRGGGDRIEEIQQSLELVDAMHDAARTAVDILNDLLLYEKVESNMMVIEPVNVHLFDAVANAVGIFKIQASAADVKLTWVRIIHRTTDLTYT